MCPGFLSLSQLICFVTLVGRLDYSIMLGLRKVGGDWGCGERLVYGVRGFLLFRIDMVRRIAPYKLVGACFGVCEVLECRIAGRLLAGRRHRVVRCCFIRCYVASCF